MKKLVFIAPALLLMACGGEAEGTTDEIVSDAVETIVEEVIEEVPVLSSDEEIQAYITEKGWEAEKHESGLYFVVDEAGEGDERPTLEDEVTIFYQGYLLDGTWFDGTKETPMTYPLSGFIQGWVIGIPMFGKGGKGKLIIPSDLAYGDRDNGQIPGGSTLMFEIDLVDWTPVTL